MSGRIYFKRIARPRQPEIRNTPPLEVRFSALTQAHAPIEEAEHVVIGVVERLEAIPKAFKSTNTSAELRTILQVKNDFGPIGLGAEPTNEVIVNRGEIVDENSLRVASLGVRVLVEPSQPPNRLELVKKFGLAFSQGELTVQTGGRVRMRRRFGQERQEVDRVNTEASFQFMNHACVVRMAE